MPNRAVEGQFAAAFLPPTSERPYRNNGGLTPRERRQESSTCPPLILLRQVTIPAARMKLLLATSSPPELSTNAVRRLPARSENTSSTALSITSFSNSPDSQLSPSGNSYPPVPMTNRLDGGSPTTPSRTSAAKSFNGITTCAENESAIFRSSFRNFLRTISRSVFLLVTLFTSGLMSMTLKKNGDPESREGEI